MASFGSLPSHNVPRKILVAVDFGTTYSGLAWAQTRKPEAQAIIQQWPGTASTDEKVPTTLQYNGSSYRWGFQIEDTERKHEWFKLGLDPTQERETDLAKKYPSTTSLSLGDEKFCEKMTVDYLTALRKHAESTLEKKILIETPKEYIITVPAVWSDTAMAKTFSCAKKAELGNGDSLKIISEPEAAGIYALDQMDPLGLHVDDTFVVCDAGGGTVDLVSYTVTALKPVPRLEEAVSGTGKMCGSIFLNRIFAKYMKDNFGHSDKWDKEVLTEAMGYFDRIIKRNFMGDEDKEYWVPMSGFPDDLRAGIKRNKLLLTGRGVKKMFEPVIREVLKLVTGQIQATKEKGKKVRAVLMIGGFGSNPYLQGRIQATIGNDIKVKEVINSWTAVVRGALIAGLAGVTPTKATIRVDTRVARQHYGTSAYTQFDEAKHDRRKRESDHFNGLHSYRIMIMHWFVQKGSPVRECEPNTFPYYWNQKVSDGPPGVIRMTIYTYKDPLNTGQPRYLDDSVSECAMLKADLSSIPKHRLHQERGGDGQMYYKIDYEIEMKRSSAKLEFALIYNGERYHTVKAEFL